MPLRLPTVSRLQTATICDASVVLKHAPQGPPSPASKRGSLLGAWAAASLRRRPLPDLGRYKVDWNIDELRAYLGEGDLLCEAAFALDHDGRAEYLGEDIGRAYPNDGRICGAADIVVKRSHALVVDLKSGSYPVPEARENWQIAALAMMSASAFGFETVTGVIVHFERGGAWKFGERHTWDAPQLAVIGSRLAAKRSTWTDAQALYDAELADPAVTLNPGCLFCLAQGCSYSRAERQENEAA